MRYLTTSQTGRTCCCRRLRRAAPARRRPRWPGRSTHENSGSGAADTACTSGAAVAASPGGSSRHPQGRRWSPFRPVRGTWRSQTPALGCPQVRPGRAAREAVTGGRSRSVAKSKSARPATRHAANTRPTTGSRPRPGSQPQMKDGTGRGAGKLGGWMRTRPVVADALRDRGIDAHLENAGIDIYGVRVVLLDRREAIWATKAPSPWRPKFCWTGTWSVSCPDTWLGELRRRADGGRHRAGRLRPAGGPGTPCGPAPRGSPWGGRAACRRFPMASGTHRLSGTDRHVEACGELPTGPRPIGQGRGPRPRRWRSGPTRRIRGRGSERRARPRTGGSSPAATSRTPRRAYPVRRVRAGQRFARDGRRQADPRSALSPGTATPGAVRTVPPAAAGGGRPGLLLDTEAGPGELGELLPGAFTGTDLSERRD